jgi:hypothetical protein
MATSNGERERREAIYHLFMENPLRSMPLVQDLDENAVYWRSQNDNTKERMFLKEKYCRLLGGNDDVLSLNKIKVPPTHEELVAMDLRVSLNAVQFWKRIYSKVRSEVEVGSLLLLEDEDGEEDAERAQEVFREIMEEIRPIMEAHVEFRREDTRRRMDHARKMLDEKGKDAPIRGLAGMYKHFSEYVKWIEEECVGWIEVGLAEELKKLKQKLLELMMEHHVFAFVSGSHVRLGGGSRLLGMEEEVMARIVELGFHIDTSPPSLPPPSLPPPSLPPPSLPPSL